MSRTRTSQCRPRLPKRLKSNVVRYIFFQRWLAADAVQEEKELEKEKRRIEKQSRKLSKVQYRVIDTAKRMPTGGFQRQIVVLWQGLICCCYARDHLTTCQKSKSSAGVVVPQTVQDGDEEDVPIPPEMRDVNIYKVTMAVS